MLAAIVIAIPLLARATPTPHTSNIQTLQPTAMDSLCLTYEPVAAYHGDTEGGTVNFVKCASLAEPASNGQHWAFPPVGQAGPIRYGRETGTMCLTVDGAAKDGNKLKLWWCLGLEGQRFVLGDDGMIEVEGNNQCLDVRKESKEELSPFDSSITRAKELQTWNCMQGSEQQTFSFNDG